MQQALTGTLESRRNEESLDAVADNAGLAVFALVAAGRSARRFAVAALNARGVGCAFALRTEPCAHSYPAARRGSYYAMIQRLDLIPSTDPFEPIFASATFALPASNWLSSWRTPSQEKTTA